MDASTSDDRVDFVLTAESGESPIEKPVIQRNTSATNLKPAVNIIEEEDSSDLNDRYSAEQRDSENGAIHFVDEKALLVTKLESERKVSDNKQ